MTALRAPGSRALLIGTGTYTEDSGLLPVPAVRATLTDLRNVLIERCGMATDAIHVLLDPDTPSEIASAVSEQAAGTTGTLLFYYVGHGLISLASELHLATRTTDRRPTHRAATALHYSIVRDCLLASDAAAKVVVLDCCFAGRAFAALSDIDAQATDLARIHGSYVLTATGQNEAALAPPGARHTAFTGELIQLLRNGDPDSPAELTLRHIFRYLHRSLPAKGFPRPRQLTSEGGDDLVIALNPAVTVNAPEEEEQSAPQVFDSVECPYQGLAPFEANDAPRYFGREGLTAGLTHQLAEHLSGSGPFWVIGPSGAGKSSLLRAGLLGSLNADKFPVPGSGTWPQILMTPGELPLGRLADNVAALAGLPGPAVNTKLNAEPRELADLARQVLRMHADGSDTSAARLVIVVDQFEEIFTRCTDAGQRSAFIRALLTTADSASSEPAPALVVLGLRADFYDSCASCPPLIRSLQDHQLVIGPMTREELQRAIQAPAAAAALTIQPGLVELLLHEVVINDFSSPEHEIAGAAGSGAEMPVQPDDGDRPSPSGKLPLLSHVLRETWHRRQGHTLTVAGYKATGGVHRAVALTAEAIYGKLNENRKTVALRLLSRMVVIGDSTSQDSLRRVSRSELLEGWTDAEASDVEQLIDDLVEARLIVAYESTCSIAHEAMLRAWPRLRDWLSEDREWLRRHSQLARSAEEWNRTGRSPSELYQGARLAVASNLASYRPGNLTALEKEFLAASTRAARKQTRRLRRLVAALSILLLTALSLTVFSFHQQAETDQQRAIALSRLVAIQADRFRESDVSLAMQLSLISYRIAPTPEARTSLMASFGTSSATRLHSATGEIKSVAFSSDKRILAVGSDDHTVQLWNVALPAKPVRVGPPLEDATSSVNAVAFSPDGRTLGVGSANGTIALWDVTAPERPFPLSPPLTGTTGSVDALAFSPNDPSILATGSTDHSVRLWNLKEPDRPTILTLPLTGFTNSVNAVAFSPDGRVLAAGSADKRVLLWNMADLSRPINQDPFFTGHSSSVHTVTFSPDGDAMATGSADGTVRLWSLDDTALPTPVDAPLRVPAGWASSISFSPDGRTLAAGTTDSSTVVWNLPTRQVVAILPSPGPVSTVAFGASSAVLATGTVNGLAFLWTLPGPVLSDVDESLYTAAFSPDGKLLAVAGTDGAVHLVDSSTFGKLTELGSPLAGPNKWINSVAFSSDGAVLAAGSADGSVWLWDTTTPTQPAATGPLRGPSGIIESIAFSPRGRVLAVGSHDNTVWLWDLRDPIRPVSLGPPLAVSGLVESVAFTADGETLAVGADDGTIRLWNIIGGPQASPTEVSTGTTVAVQSISFSGASPIMAAGLDDGTVRLWDVSNAAQPLSIGAPLAGPASYVKSVAFSPDGRILAAGSDDRAAWLWDLSIPEQPVSFGPPLTGPTGWISSVTFSPDGHTLAATSADGSLRIWDTDVDQAIKHICAVSGDPLSPAEWERYVGLDQFSYQPPCQ